MGVINKLVKRAQRRLWFNHWLMLWGWVLTITAGLWTLTWLADRLLGLKWPMDWAALGGLVISLVASIIWFLSTRESPIAAATALDQAAGLRERVSTGLHLPANAKDPFEAAVIADAERAVAGISPRKLLPLRWSRSMSLSILAMTVALLSLLLPEFDLLHKDASAQAQAQTARQQRVRIALAKPISVLRDIAKKNPDLDIGDDNNRQIGAFNNQNQRDPDFKRRTVVKQLNRLADALKNKTDGENFQALKEIKKRLRQVGPAGIPKSDLSLLMAKLSTGDFQGAQNEIKKMQEQLAKRAHAGSIDPEKLKAMQRKLNALANKLDKAATDKQSEQDLKNAGLTAEQTRRVLNALAKKDPRQLEKMAKELSERLKAKGYSQDQIKQMLKKIQQRQQASKQLKGMGQKMAQSAKAMEQGNMKQAQAKLGEAGDMLSEMEQMDEALNELDAQMSQLQSASEDLGDFDPENDDLDCKLCKGTGFLPDGSPCPRCNGTGQCSNRGRASGARERDDSGQTATVNRRAKTKRGAGGSIIGQQFVKGKLLKGQSKAEFLETIGANEIDPTDTINRDRIPHVYRNGVRRFFDRLDRRDLPPDSQDNPPQKEDSKPSSE